MRTILNEMLVILLMLVIVSAMVGCSETAQRTVYGKGDPPAEYQTLFGNDNGARLDYVQNQAINGLVKRINVLEDPNEVAK